MKKATIPPGVEWRKKRRSYRDCNSLSLLRRTPFASGTARVNQRRPSSIDSQPVPNEENICVSQRISSRYCLPSSSMQTMCMRSLPRPYENNVTAKPRANLVREANRHKLASQSQNHTTPVAFHFPSVTNSHAESAVSDNTIIVQLKALNPH